MGFSCQLSSSCCQLPIDVRCAIRFSRSTILASDDDQLNNVMNKTLQATLETNGGICSSTAVKVIVRARQTSSSSSRCGIVLVSLPNPCLHKVLLHKYRGFHVPKLQTCSLRNLCHCRQSLSCCHSCMVPFVKGLLRHAN